MKRNFGLFWLMIFAMLFFFGCEETTAPVESSAANTQPDAQLGEKNGANGGKGYIVVANRGSGSISVIDVKTDEVVSNPSLPGGPGEPMYVVHVKQSRRVFVGDRANDRVVVFRDSDFSEETSVPTGRGVFHMWADKAGKQLWVNNDIDNTTTVIDPSTLQVIATPSTPADLVELGGKPHDVILGPQDKFAYVTVLGIDGPHYVVQYSTQTFQETGRAAVGQDPHLSLTPGSRFLYVPCQGSNAVFVLDRLTMEVLDEISVPGAHGAGMPVHGNIFYTSNISGGGADGLYAINTHTNEVIGSSDTPYAAPHNIAFPTSAKKLYLTHSGGAADKVTVYKISQNNPLPELLGEITVGLNPFGLAFVQ